MQLQERINAFISLSTFLSQFISEKIQKQDHIPQNDIFFEGMKELWQKSKIYNGWFTEDNLCYAFQSWYEALSEKNIKQWLSEYNIIEKSPKTIALIMAGNIPLVGFHDFLSVLISGNKVLVKLSSKDKYLLPYLANYLIAIEPKFEEYISFTEEKLVNFDAIIATGSNNSARYFEYYFGKYPNIIRKNRNSVAVLTGKETTEQLLGLADDIFRYFGLGCRNVSKLYIPKDYHFDSFFNAIFSWKQVIQDSKYMNNYDYNKAVYLMSPDNYRGKLLDNEFLLLKEDKSFSSPIAVLFYETYGSLSELNKTLKSKTENIQCIASEADIIENTINFGTTQKPELWDYADGVDTLGFLLKLPE